MNENSNKRRTSEYPTNNKSLDPEKVGVDSQFALLFHYRFVYPDTCTESPVAGNKTIKAWSEQALVLVVYVNNSDWPPSRHYELFYGLSRSHFGSGLEPTIEVQRKLLDAALPIIRADIERIGATDLPDSLANTKFVGPL